MSWQTAVAVPAPDTALSAAAEELLLDAGCVDEAYARYGIQAASANTHIATLRVIAKRYPTWPSRSRDAPQWARRRSCVPPATMSKVGLHRVMGSASPISDHE